MQRMENSLVKGLIALSKDKNLKRSNDLKDGFCLIANALFELNTLRKEFMKQDMTPSTTILANLCIKTHPLRY